MQIQNFNNSALSRSVNLDMDISSPYTEMNVKQLNVQNKPIGGKVIIITLKKKQKKNVILSS